jgi:hypothetical protein
VVVYSLAGYTDRREGEAELTVGVPASKEAQHRILRDVNERVHDVLVRLGTDGAQGQYLCECGRRGCLGTVQLYAHEYEAIRGADGIVLEPGHQA